jgi:hypothetical protein
MESPLEINQAPVKDRSINSQEPLVHKLAKATKPHLIRMGDGLATFGHQIRPWIGKKNHTHTQARV